MSYDQWNNRFVMTLNGGVSHNVDTGRSAIGNITRLDNELARCEECLAGVKRSLEQTKEQMEAAKLEVQKPFEQEAELQEKLARQAQLDAELDLDHGKNAEIVDDNGVIQKEQPVNQQTEEHISGGESAEKDDYIEGVDRGKESMADSSDKISPAIHEKMDELREQLKELNNIHRGFTKSMEEMRGKQDSYDCKRDSLENGEYIESSMTEVSHKIAFGI